MKMKIMFQESKESAWRNNRNQIIQAMYNFIDWKQIENAFAYQIIGIELSFDSIDLFFKHNNLESKVATSHQLLKSSFGQWI